MKRVFTMNRILIINTCEQCHFWESELYTISGSIKCVERGYCFKLKRSVGTKIPDDCPLEVTGNEVTR